MQVLHLFFFFCVCLRFPLLGKVLQAQSSLLHIYSHTHMNLFGILNPSGQISLIWAENKILRNKAARNLHTHVWIRRIQSRNKQQRHSHFQEEIMEKCHQVRLSGQSSDTHTHTQQSVLRSVTLPLWESCVAFSLPLMYTYTKRNGPRLTST